MNYQNEKDQMGGDSESSDPRLRNLPFLLREFRLGRLPIGWRGNRIFDNSRGELPGRHHGYYGEFYLETSAESGSLKSRVLSFSTNKSHIESRAKLKEISVCQTVRALFI
jgi:hypothetical protein